MERGAGVASAQERTASRLRNAESPFPCGRDVPRFLVSVAVIALCSSLLGTVLPGLIAAHGRAFYTDQVKNRIRTRLVKYKSLEPAATSLDLQDDYKSKIAAIDKQLASFVEGPATPNDQTKTPPPQWDDVRTLESVRTIVQAQLKEEQSRYTIAGFFLSTTMLVWTAMYISLTILMVLLIPRRRWLLQHHSLLLLYALGIIYVLYESPVWLRNSVFLLYPSPERRLFSYANFDISPSGFLTQEANTILLFGLLWLLWNQGYEAFLHRQCRLQETVNDPITVESAMAFSDTFLHWQVSSFVLALGFIVFTGVFWDFIIAYKDRRYIVPAVIMHTLWICSWWILSLPLLITWEDFSRKRMRLRLQTASSQPKPQGETGSDSLADISPISLWNGVGSVAAAVASFGLPIVHAFMK